MAELSLLPNLWQACWKDNDLRFVHFKKLWRECDCGKLHNVRLPEEDDEPFMQELFRYVTDKLLGEADSRRRAFYVFTLYVLHETQVTEQLYKILMPEYMWSILTDMLKAFVKLEVNDPYYVLRSILDRGMISFTLEYNFLPQDVVPGPSDDNKFAGLVAPPEYVGNMGATSNLNSHLELSALDDLCVKYSQVMSELTPGYPQQQQQQGNGDSNSGNGSAQPRAPDDPNQRLLAQLKHVLKKHQVSITTDEAARENKQADGDEVKAKDEPDKKKPRKRRTAKSSQPVPVPDFTDITKHGRPKHENLPVSEGVQKALDQWAKAKIKESSGSSKKKKGSKQKSDKQDKSKSQSNGSVAVKSEGSTSSSSASKSKSNSNSKSKSKSKSPEKTESNNKAESKAEMEVDTD